MKKQFLATTALTTVSALAAAGASAAEAPTWTLSGNANFQVYFAEQDFLSYDTTVSYPTYSGVMVSSATTTAYTTGSGSNLQDHGWYFGVDESELQLNVSGTADNGLKYGLKIELNANTDDGKMADEVRISLGGAWGTLHLGDEDGAEDIMNYGGENIMGATGGFDGDFGDVLIRYRAYVISGMATDTTGAAPSAPTIRGDTGDSTKITYYSPRFSGIQVGASITPTPNNGDTSGGDGSTQNHIGAGINYDNQFGGVRVRASAVYSGAESLISEERAIDISAWSVGGIVDVAGFSFGANYTDNGDSWSYYLDDGVNNSYWNVAAGYEAGPLYVSGGYFMGSYESDSNNTEFSNISLTADYSIAPGLKAYAEINMIEDDQDEVDTDYSNDATIFIAGMSVSF